MSAVLLVRSTGAADEATSASSPAVATFDVEHRVPWTTSNVHGFPEPPPPYRAVRAYPNLQLEMPLMVRHLPGTEWMLAAEHKAEWGGPGRIVRFHDDPAVAETETFLDVPLIVYGVAFHPRFAENGYLYVGGNGLSEKLGEKTTQVVRYTVGREPPYDCDPESALVIIEWPSDGHNGGDPAFGPDGMLYVSAGDGTSDSDTNLMGQNLSTLNGTMVRIDVDHAPDGETYAVPPDNPFVPLAGARPEIWAYGLRNPWRITFDARTGDLWVGNNGQDLWETAHLIRRGDNCGWSVMEGSHPFQLAREHGPTPFVPPTIEHPHSEARSLTGGRVYYGDALPELRGAYIYGDYSTGMIWGARHDGRRLTWHEPLARTSLAITGFGTDPRGELLIVDHGGGFYYLEPAPPPADTRPFPTRLSETGLFESVAARRMQPGLIPYSVNSRLWSDGAVKERFIGLPGTEQIDFNPKDSWDFPAGTVLVKTFSLPVVQNDGGADATSVAPRPIETRLLTLEGHEWFGYSYLWNDDLTDATLVESAGRDRTYRVADASAPGGVREQSWHYPSRTECMVCHSRAAKFVLGLSTPQLNRVHDYGTATANQLVVLDRLGILRRNASGAPKEGERDRNADEGNSSRKPNTLDPLDPADYARLADPADDSLPVEERVRSYLHANCAHCHVKAGGGNARLDLAFSTALDETQLIGPLPQHDTYGIADARVVAPGSPERSILLSRLTRRGTGQMPPLASSRVDETAVELIRRWIAELPAEASGGD